MTCPSANLGKRIFGGAMYTVSIAFHLIRLKSTSVLNNGILGSDIVSVHTPMQDIVILGSFKAAMDLLDKRSQLYSDRPQSTMVKL